MKRWEHHISHAEARLRGGGPSLEDLARDGWEPYGVIGDGDVYMRRLLFLCARSTCGHRFDAHSPFRGWPYPVHRVDSHRPNLRHHCRHPACNCASFVFESDLGQ